MRTRDSLPSPTKHDPRNREDDSYRGYLSETTRTRRDYWESRLWKIFTALFSFLVGPEGWN